MRWAWALILAGCVASEAAPPFAGGSSPGGGGGTVPTVDSTLATCQGLTPVEGDICYPTDSPYTLVARVAGTWSYRYPGIGFDVTPPPSAGWTAYNSGSVAAVGGVRVLTSPAETVVWRGETRARPSDPTVTPYTVTMVLYSPWLGATAASGLGSIGAGHTDATALHALYSGGGVISRAIYSTSADSSYVSSQDLVALGGNFIAVKIVEDGTNRSHYIGSLDTGTWVQVGTSTSRTGTFTATGTGWWAKSFSTTAAREVHLVHYAEGTP